MVLSIPTPPDFSFHETVHAHGWRQLLPFAWDAETNTLIRIEAAEDGRQVTLRIGAAGDRVAVESDGEMPEGEVAARVQRALQLDLPVGAFHSYCESRPELAHIPRRKLGRMLRCPTLWEDTVKVICTTNTTWAQTKGMVARICAIRDGAFPSPQQIAAIPAEEFAATARLGYRNGAVHRIATEIASGARDLESWNVTDLTTEALWKNLLTLPGIGPYGAACLMLYLGRGSRVNVDSWARTLVSKELGRKVIDKEVHAFFAPYGEWAGFVYHFYDWQHERKAAESLEVAA